jgi:cbb3-type cytochrome oxidase cytochrome c subunit
MENEDNSPDLQRVGQIKDRLFTTSTEVNPQEVARKKQEHPEREMPSFPFLYQG